jgi:hypothetical protein
MKKIIMLISLSVVMILCGCAFMTSGRNYNPVPNAEISESLISKMQSNIGAHSIEGFTRESTFGEVLDKVSVKKISQAKLTYPSELLGYPTIMECVFDNFGGNQLTLDFMAFSVIPGGERSGYETKIEELLSAMDAELGSHESSSDEFSDEYSWDQNDCSIDILADKDIYEQSGVLADITVCADVVVFGIIPKSPDMFPYRLGTDIGTVYQSEAPGMLPMDFEYSGSLQYEDGDMEISLQFKTDAAGRIRLSKGRYDIYLNTMGFEDSLDYFESLADGLENAIGKPDARGYGIPDVDEDIFGISGFQYELTGGAQGLSAQDILDSGNKYYWMDMSWKSVHFRAEYVTDANIELEFSEEYINGK